MFFKDCITEVAPIYSYQHDYLKQGLAELAPFKRAFISKSNSVYNTHSTAACNYVSQYIASQQHIALKNFIPRRHHILELVDSPNFEPFFNTTYFDRVCQLVMVPMRGSISYKWTNPKEKLDVRAALEVGKAYLLNNRAPRQVIDVSADYQCYISMWIDFDLMYYLKEHDGNSVIDRKADEYF